jgi:hypothetical protein
MALLIVIVLSPYLWQIPRTFWPLHLNADATRFTGLYRRYKIDTFTGQVGSIGTSVDTHTVGNVTGWVSDSGHVSISDNRKTFQTNHTNFFLTDRSGAVQAVDAINVGPAIAPGHLVSAAWLVHNGKRGNAFLVYNHATGAVYIEKTRQRMKNAPRGISKMVIKMPLVYQVLGWLLIVTWILMIPFAIGAELQLWWFRKHAAKPLVKRLSQQAVEAT